MAVVVPSSTKSGLPSPGTAGSLARVSDSTRGLWMDTGTLWFALSGAVVNVREFGAKGDGSTSPTDLAAFNAALAALPSSGGVIFMPPGNYTLDDTFDLTSGPPTVSLIGCGPRSTTITTSVGSGKAGINAASASTSFNRLAHFTLNQSGNERPSSQLTGNYGIRNTSAIGYHLSIEDVEVNYFANGGIHIEGGTGPTVIRDCSI